MRLLPLLTLASALVVLLPPAPGSDLPAGPQVRVGAAAVELEADDDMVIGGSILPYKVTGQDGQLRAVAVVIEKPGQGKLVVAACDVLMMARDLLDPVVEEVTAALGVP